MADDPPVAGGAGRGNVPEVRGGVNGVTARTSGPVAPSGFAPYPSAMPETPSPIAAAYALLLLIGMPALAALDARRGANLADAAQHRRLLYVSVGASLVVLGLVTLGVAAWQDVPPEALRWTVSEPGAALLWGLAVAVAGLILSWLLTVVGRWTGLRETAAVMLLMPRDAAQKRGFLVLAGIAAVCEEYAYRGFGLWAVSAWTGNVWLGAALVSLSFGLGHGYQNLVGVLRATVLGMVLAVTVIWSSSLFPAIVGHFWINAAIGLGGWRYLHAEFGPDNVDGNLTEDEER